MLSLDTCRCAGTKCGIKETCLRFSDKPVGGMRVPYSDNLCLVLIDETIGVVNDRKYWIGEQNAV